MTIKCRFASSCRHSTVWALSPSVWVRSALGVRSALLVLLIVIWGLVACGPPPIPEEPATSTVTPVAPQFLDEGIGTPTAESRGGEAAMTPTSTPGATEFEPPAEAETVVRLAREDLAQRLGQAPAAIQLVSVEAVQWRDTSLGCPQPGMMYAQVITPGFRMVLEVEGKKYDYHTDRGRIVVLCEE